MFLRIKSTIRRKGANPNTFPVTLHDIFTSFYFLNDLPYGLHISPRRRDNQVFVKEMSFRLEEFLIMPNIYLHTMRICLSHDCVLLLRFMLFVCPVSFRTMSWLKQYIYFYIFLFSFLLCYSQMSVIFILWKFVSIN